MTTARSPTASSTASRTACCSPSWIVGASPVVPRTTRPSCACRSTRCAASSCAPDRSIDPSSVRGVRSEEHTSELQSRQYLVCRLLLEKKKSHARHYSERDSHCDIFVCV